jgi:hypothetical protein
MTHERAAQENISVGALLTTLPARRAITSKTDLHNVHEIRFFIQVLRDIYSTGQPLNDERLRPVLDAAVDALKRVIGLVLQKNIHRHRRPKIFGDMSRKPLVKFLHWRNGNTTSFAIICRQVI